MVLSKVFIHLVFQGSSEDECQSMEASHNSVAVVNDDEATSGACTNTSPSSNPTPNTTSPLVVATAAVREGQEPSASPPPTTLGRSHAPDGSKGQFSREQCGGEPADKQHGERQRERVCDAVFSCIHHVHNSVSPASLQ